MPCLRRRSNIKQNINQIITRKKNIIIMVIKMTGRCVNIVEENMKRDSVQNMEKNVMNVEKKSLCKNVFI